MGIPFLEVSLAVYQRFQIASFIPFDSVTVLLGFDLKERKICIQIYVQECSSQYYLE